MKKFSYIIILILIIGCGSSEKNSIKNTEHESNTTLSYIEPQDENISNLIFLEDSFVRNNKQNEGIQAIWNLALKTSEKKDIDTFDIGINIVKNESNTMGNILIKGISIENNRVTHIDSLIIFGKKASGSTGSIIYDADNNLTQKVVIVEKDLLLIRLGYIMENQTIISKQSFYKKAYYDIHFFISKINIKGASIIEDDYSLQVEYNLFHTFFKGTNTINGLIIIKD